MDGEFPEQFKCPICFEIPEKEIYQCKNGHTLCDVCVESLALCPQCRVDIKSSRIRSRPLEELLDMMKFNCSNKNEGCKAKVTRREITNHFDNCLFGGDRVPLCKYLGYTCSHIVNSKNPQESLQHFKQQHQSLSTNEPTLDIKLKNIKTVDPKMRCLWKPILVNCFGNYFVLIICSLESNVLFSCITFNKDLSDKVQIKYVMPAKTDKAPVLEWTTKSFSCIESEIMLKSPPFQFSRSLLAEQYLQSGDVTFQVTMTNDNFSSVNKNKATLILDSFITLQLQQPDSASWTMVQKSDFGFGRIMNAIRAKFNTPFVSGAHCNVCRVKQLVGIRFKCLQCCDYDVCSKCIEQKEHSFHHFAVICTNEQENSIRYKCGMSSGWRAFVNLPELNRNGRADLFGSALLDAKELYCKKCTKLPDYMCLQCSGPFGLCKYCFVDEMHKHNKDHFFALTPSDAAREFVLYVLRKQNILPRLNHEVFR